MRSFDLWLPEVRVAVSGADDALLKQQIAATIREFFTRGTWTEELFGIKLVEGRDRYVFGPLASYYAIYLMTARVDDAPIAVYPAEPTAHQGTLGVWVDASAEQVVLTEVPDSTMAGSKLYMTAILKPLKTCTQVPNRVYEMFFDEILDGVKGKLFSMTSKPWSDRQMGAFHNKRFSVGIARARTAMRKGYSSAEPPWRFPRWA